MTPTRRPGLIRSLALAPFELAFGLLAMWAGVAGLFAWTPQAMLFNINLPRWLSALSNLLYAIAGLAIIVGHLRTRRPLEAFGLVVLASSLVIRAGVLWWLVGLTAFSNSAVVNAVAVLGAITVRLWVLITGRIISIIEPARSTDEHVDGIVGKVL